VLGVANLGLKLNQQRKGDGTVLNDERCLVHMFRSRYPPCRRSDIAVYLPKRVRVRRRKYELRFLPVCMEHWKKIAGSNLEWTADGKVRNKKRRKKKK